MWVVEVKRTRETFNDCNYYMYKEKRFAEIILLPPPLSLRRNLMSRLLLVDVGGKLGCCVDLCLSLSLCTIALAADKLFYSSVVDSSLGLCVCLFQHRIPDHTHPFRTHPMSSALSSSSSSASIQDINGKETIWFWQTNINPSDNNLFIIFINVKCVLGIELSRVQDLGPSIYFLWSVVFLGGRRRIEHPPIIGAWNTFDLVDPSVITTTDLLALLHFS